MAATARRGYGEGSVYRDAASGVAVGLGDIYVRKDETGEIVYQGPDADEVPSLISDLMTCLNDPVPEDQRLIQAGMAHLNLVMIHPRDDRPVRVAPVGRSLKTSWRSGPVDDGGARHRCG